MKSISEIIEEYDYWSKGCKSFTITCEAWQTLKAHCTQPTAHNSSSHEMLTRDEMWEHLKGLPTPSTNVLLSGGMMMYYVDACYDYMCQHFVR